MPQVPPNIQSNTVMPTELNRAITQNALETFQGRIMQNIDTLWFLDRIRRGGGIARNQLNGQSVTVTNAFVWTSRQCKLGTLSYTNGTIVNTPGDGTVGCTGPLPLWADASGSGMAINEDLGVAGAGIY